LLSALAHSTEVARVMESRNEGRMMDEHAEEQRELALLDRENQDDAREL